MDALIDALQSQFAFLAEHVVAVVFCAFLVEAAGIPLPSRLILVLSATAQLDFRGLAELVLAATAGASIGDHVPYLAGMFLGSRFLAFYCRVTLGSERCVEKTIGYFRRFGAAAILVSRFSASVRIFASALSGCGHIAYPRFLAYDVAGTLIYASLWVAVGRVVGEHAGDLLRSQNARLLVLVGPIALGSLLAYRLWRRRRHGPARADVAIVGLEPECEAEMPKARSA